MSNRMRIKALPVSPGLLAGALETYHEEFVEPHLRRLDRAVALLVFAAMVLAAAVVYLVVGG